jgi:hypothetical protein
MTRFQLTIRYGNCESAVVNHHGPISRLTSLRCLISIGKDMDMDMDMDMDTDFELPQERPFCSEYCCLSTITDERPS